MPSWREIIEVAASLCDDSETLYLSLVTASDLISVTPSETLAATALIGMSPRVRWQ